jgi:glycosyltransferase involved in cell wall biosynthesis
MQKILRPPIVLAVHFPRFGPYHLARINGAFEELKAVGVKIVGMETSSLDDTYAWQQEEGATAFERRVALPGSVYERSSRLEMWRGVRSVLESVNPDAMAIHGYSTADAWSALAWCNFHSRKAILLCDSKYDDMPRHFCKERLKQRLVRRFDAALCAGTASRTYLERLGMEPEQIFEGFDAVDNDFFWRGAEQARRDPALYRSMPGLDSPDPFFLVSGRFIREKNLDGLLRSYTHYRRVLAETDGGRVPWRLVILGDGPERKALEHLVWSEGIQGVSFPGFLQIDQLPIYYGLASCFVHPSRQDTWGLVVNEAMAAGLPVLVSKSSGCAQDLVCEGENGFTFVWDDATTLAGLMTKVSTGQLNLQAMGVSSLNRIKDWGLTRFAQGLYGALQAASQRGQATSSWFSTGRKEIASDAFVAGP